AVGALLHDFYLYDWHRRSTFHGLHRLLEMHGFSHPSHALVNAKQYFQITPKEQNIISCHMWPLTFRHVPRCREAVIVCLADKYCAVIESMFQRSNVGAFEHSDREW
ncbi:MAG: HD family phosphohydrolase, partial [Faecalibacterium sp.]